jgi:hypothetical protein
MSISNLFYPNNYDLFANTLTLGSGSTGATGTLNLQNIILGSTGPQTQPALLINNSDTSNTSIIEINCTNPVSRISMSNSNASSVANGLQTYGSDGTLRFQCGNNNSDGTSYVYGNGGHDLKFGVAPSPSFVNTEVLRLVSNVTPNTIQLAQPLSLNSNGCVIYKWATSTFGASDQEAYVFAPPRAGTYTLSTQGQVFNESNGHNASFSVQTRFVYFGGTLTAGTNLSSNSSNDGVLTSCTLTQIASVNTVGDIAVKVVGQVTEAALNWSGVTTITY